ncbi:MAG: M14 family zinc carboxypeptidase, partial [Calditrichia bacterium]
GDELSSCDAAVQLAYQLAAGTDSATTMLRRELVIGIDPMENPDGRERYLGQMQQWNGLLPNSDVQSMQHSGLWTAGRGNHYLFDLNRDWFILENPESRARVQAIREWQPQLIVDAHEMGPLNTYLFPPSREPININITETIKYWNKIFSEDQAKAFDEYGWSYYTREWFEDWYPGYGSNMPHFRGAIGILYEQASTDGSLVKRHDGTILTFRDAVHHQFTSSMANLKTLAKNREKILSDFYHQKKYAMNFSERTGIKVFYIVPGKNVSRVNRFVEKLVQQGIDVEIAQKDFKAEGLQDYWSRKKLDRQLPAGTLIVPLNQPLSLLANAILEFDPRPRTSFMEEERKSLLKKKSTRLYEVSAWSLLMAYGLEAYTGSARVNVSAKKILEIPLPEGTLSGATSAYGYVWDNTDDRAIDALIQFMSKGIQIRAAKKPFRVEGQEYPRGSFLIRLIENPNLNSTLVKKVASETGVTIQGVNTALSESGSDLGGNDFQLLTPPRIALLTGHSISTTSFSALWYLLDRELQVKHSLINHTRLGGTDLRTYNVLILPSTWGGKETYQKLLGKENIKKIKSWVAAGGTIIGIGNAAAFLADTATGFSKVRLRQQVLQKLALYKEAAEKELNPGQVAPDSISLWEKAPTVADTPQNSGNKADKELLAKYDEHLRLFQPRGAILRANLDEEHWLNFGLGKKLPVIFYSPYAYLTADPVQTAARLGSADHLRLSGILWPETRTRWEKTAYATRESLGKGQVILFAGEPYFRAYFLGSGRMLVNAILLGPGMGTRAVMPW